MKKKYISLLVIVSVLVFSVFILMRPTPTTDKEVAKCIGENSIIYSQLGCSHCADQKNLFGDNYKYITEIDCFYNRDACIEKGISGTPTWEIKGQLYSGVQSIEKLKELTGC